MDYDKQKQSTPPQLSHPQNNPSNAEQSLSQFWLWQEENVELDRVHKRLFERMTQDFPSKGFYISGNLGDSSDAISRVLLLLESNRC